MRAQRKVCGMWRARGRDPVVPLLTLTLPLWSYSLLALDVRGPVMGEKAGWGSELIGEEHAPEDPLMR